MKAQLIRNPILPGFNPDPSICRVGDDYYVANSTFEWFPGVQIHHSKDLIHWRLLTRPLTRLSQLDMTGIPNSGGIWAPCLSHDGNLFHLIYTNVFVRSGGFVDCDNFLTTAPDVMGSWSEPIYLNSSGFDASLFHDTDGRKWHVNMQWDHRLDRNHFSGIVLQEYDPKKRKLVGPIVNIFRGTTLAVTEGPHLYKRNGYYYLWVAEGGTAYEHAESVARSRSLTGPYEVHPDNPIITAADKPDSVLQKTGHASLVETQTGEWYLVHLAGRPVGPDRRCILGRETAIQKCEWGDDGWIRLATGGNRPQEDVPRPKLPEHPFDPEPTFYDFDGPKLPLAFQTIRLPADPSWLDLTSRPSRLRLRAQGAPNSMHRQSIVGRRAESFRCSASTCMEFKPKSFLECAGLLAMYDVYNYYYLAVTLDDNERRVLTLFAMDRNEYKELLPEPVPIKDGPVYLKSTIDHDKVWFQYSMDGTNWKPIGKTLDATILSDEYCNGFTGAFFALGTHDMLDHTATAEFDWFKYEEE